MSTAPKKEGSFAEKERDTIHPKLSAKYIKDKRLFRIMYTVPAVLLIIPIFLYLLVGGEEVLAGLAGLIILALFGFAGPKHHLWRIYGTDIDAFEKKERSKQQAKERGEEWGEKEEEEWEKKKEEGDEKAAVLGCIILIIGIVIAITAGILWNR